MLMNDFLCLKVRAQVRLQHADAGSEGCAGNRPASHGHGRRLRPLRQGQ